MSIETARLVRNLKPYDDGSGHRYTVQVLRNKDATRHDGARIEVVIRIDQGGDHVTIAVNDWGDLRDAVDKAVEHVSEYED
jgi:hypothetical protein